MTKQAPFEPGLALVPRDFHVRTVNKDRDEARPPEWFHPRKDLPGTWLARPVDWNADPFVDRNWRFQLSAWRMLDPLWKRAGEAPREADVRTALAFVADWHARHNDGAGSDYAWDDMATGLRAQHIAWIAHLAGNGAWAPTAAEQRLLADLATTHYAKLCDPAFLSRGNHGIFQVHGARLLELVSEGGLLPRLANGSYFQECMLDLIESQFGVDGVHREGAPFYHYFIERQMRRVRPELYPLVADGMRRRLAHAQDVTPWLVMPDGKFAAIGDTEGRGPLLRSLKLADGRLAIRRGGDRYIHRAWPDSGYAVVRTDPLKFAGPHSMLFVSMGSLLGRAHDHADELGFELFHAGGPLVIDAGKYGYEDDDWRRYFLSDMAHNVAGYPDVGFMPGDTTQAGSCMREVVADANSITISGRVERRRLGRAILHERVFHYLPREQLSIEDRLETDGTARPEARFHFHEDIEARDFGGTIELVRSGAHVATVELPARAVGYRLAKGGNRWPFYGWRSPSYLKRVETTTLVIELADDGDWHRTKIRLYEPSSIDAEGDSAP